MSFDGFVTGAISRQLQRQLIGGKIEKIYQPEAEEIVLNIHANREHFMLYISAASSHARIHLTDIKYENPQNPMAFCMLLRKHLQGGRIKDIQQKDSERITEFSVDTINELGFSINKKLIVETMGKHSNIIVLDITTNKIIDSIKRISIDVNRYRQILPGQQYIYPPDQNKVPYYQITEDDIADVMKINDIDTSKALMSKIQGLSPTLADEMLAQANYMCEACHLEAPTPKLIHEILQKTVSKLINNQLEPKVYLDHDKRPVDFHMIPLSALREYYEEVSFSEISQAVDYYYLHKASSNRLKQKTKDLEKAVTTNLDKLYLKKQRLSEDLLLAEKSDIYKLNGELLTANLHAIDHGATSVTLLNYYDNSQATINLNTRLTPAQNAQAFYKKYNKSKTAVIEKNNQLEESGKDIMYLESILSYIESVDSVEEIEELRLELIEGGYMRKRKNNYKPSKKKPEPLKYTLKSGIRISVGKNNKENDHLTFKLAGNKDIWFHTKDIPGSHLILFTEGNSISDEDILEAAAIAAFHSKGKNSSNVPVDYTKVKNVKKPSGAKPGMVIFVDNKTVYVNPSLPTL